MSFQQTIAHQKSVAKSTELLLFSNIISRISIICILIISAICYCLLVLNSVGGTLAHYTKRIVMFTTERSRDFGRWCMTLGQGILALSVMDISEKSLFSSPVLSTPPKCKAPQRTAPVPIISKPAVPKSVVPKSAVSKPTAPRQQKSSPELPPLSMIGEISLKQSKKSTSCNDARYRPIIPSSLGPNRPSDREKIAGTCLSQRFSTSAFSRPKRSMSTKLIDSTAANRVTISQKSRVAAITRLSHSIYDKKSKVVIDTPPIEDESASLKKSNISCDDKETIIKDKNMKLGENRPMVYQQRRRLHNNKSPSMTLQLARRYLKTMLKVKMHRNTI